jgi:hypothetical protein
MNEVGKLGPLSTTPVTMRVRSRGRDSGIRTGGYEGAETWYDEHSRACYLGVECRLGVLEWLQGLLWLGQPLPHIVVLRTNGGGVYIAVHLHSQQHTHACTYIFHKKNVHYAQWSTGEPWADEGDLYLYALRACAHPITLPHAPLA